MDEHFADALHDAFQTHGRGSIRTVILTGSKSHETHLEIDHLYEDLLANAAAIAPTEPEENDPVILMYTGGTTGLPKGVVHTQRSEVLNLYHCIMARNPFSPGQISLVQTPLFHAAIIPVLLGSFISGCATAMIPAFKPEDTLTIIEKEQVALTMMVPTMIGMMLNHPTFNPQRLASLKTLFYGASPMPPAILEKLVKTLPTLSLWQGYGMTEAATTLTNLSPEDHRKGGKRLQSVGVPSPGIDVSIQDERGIILPVGETGEVCSRGGNFMKEYWNKPEQTEKSFEGGWYHTGDAGYLDEEGYLFLVDRVKDMIISGGENIYSIEVENAISSHPDIAQVAVIRIPHDTWGEAVHAIIVLEDGKTITPEAIIAHAKQTIAGYKVPKSIEFRETPLPLSGAMKVLKRELRAPFWNDT